MNIKEYMGWQIEVNEAGQFSASRQDEAGQVVCFQHGDRTAAGSIKTLEKWIRESVTSANKYPYPCKVLWGNHLNEVVIQGVRKSRRSWWNGDGHVFYGTHVYDNPKLSLVVDPTLAAQFEALRLEREEMGERHSAECNLLEQRWEALAAEPGLVVVKADDVAAGRVVLPVLPRE